jgi:pantothenate kinase type III
MMQVLEQDESIALSHADHGWRWSFQNQEPMPLAVADIGNTAVKIAWYDDALSPTPDRVLVHSHQENDDTLRQALTTLKQHSSCPYPTLHIVSVRPEQTKLLTRLAQECGWSAVTVRKRPVRRHCNLHSPGYLLKDLGIDRLAAIEAWLSMLTSEQRQLQDHYGIVVAAGTATTIDAVGVDGRHFGGLILPGLTLAMQSLHQVASLLPEITAEKALTADIAGQGLGHDTRTAMMCAAVEMTIGAINQTRTRLRDYMHLHELPHGISMTGGWGERLAPLIGATYQPNLVLNGARVLVLGGWQKPN